MFFAPSANIVPGMANKIIVVVNKIKHPLVVLKFNILSDDPSKSGIRDRVTIHMGSLLLARTDPKICLRQLKTYRGELNSRLIKLYNS